MSTVVTTMLAECEAVIEKGLRSFVETGEALARIRDGRLYRESHETFEDYCRERWDLSRPRAYQLMGAAETTVIVSTNVDTAPPRSEAVARQLAPLRDKPETLRETWTEVIEQHGPAPTAAQVREVVKRAAEPKPEPHIDYCPTCGHRIPAGRPLPQRTGK